MKTTALIVGVERYGGPWDLDGPANDAMAIVRWLQCCGVPDSSLRLFISPLPEKELPDFGPDLRVNPATSAEILTALHALQNDNAPDHLLFLYWSGHGLMKQTSTRRLLYADASERNMVNLDLQSLLESLATNAFPFARQVLIIDACANHVELLRLPWSVPDQSFPFGRPAARQQFVIQSGKDGEYSANISGVAGVFTRELLRLVPAESRWPPDMEQLARQLGQRFNQLRAEGEYRQTPIFYAYRDWQGNQTALGNIPAGGPARSLSARQRLSPIQVDALRDILTRIPWMLEQDERTALLEQIRTEIYVQVPRSKRAGSDIRAIVATSERYPNGLRELLRAVRGVDPREQAATEFENMLSTFGVIDTPNACGEQP